jgi:predicted permease
MFRKLFRRKRNSSDFAAEVQSHIQLEEERLRAQGLSPEEAHGTAYRAFGNVTKTQERFYESGHWLWLDNLWRDIVYAARMLRNSPSFTFAAVATLAVAIGANAMVFAALNALIIRPLNLPGAQSLFAIQRVSNHFPAQSYPDYLDLRDRNSTFDGLAAYNIGAAGMSTSDDSAPVWVYEVSGNYLDALGIQPYLGHFFHASDERGANSAPYVVLTYAFWHNHFQDDRSLVGRTVQLNKHPFTIVGVTPPGFRGTLLFFSPDVFVPMVDEEQIDGSNLLNARNNRWVFETLGHLKPGVTPAQAVADLNSIGLYLEKTYPKDDAKMSFELVRSSLLGDYLSRPARAFLTALMLLAGLILLAACANLGSLFAARAADRSREVALRLALGASRVRVLRQLFTEAVLISLLGGAVGLWGSIMLLQWFSVWQPFPQFPINIPIAPDAHVYELALLLSIASGFLFGAVPIRQILHTNPYGIIKSGSLTNVGRRITARDILLAAQIAICAVLVTSSFVAVRGLVRSMHGNFGFDPNGAMLVETDLNMSGYRGGDVAIMQKRMVDALKAIPGVDSVGLSSYPPLSNGKPFDSLVFTDKTSDLRPTNAAADAMFWAVSPEYFQAAGTALLAGRNFTWRDDEKAPRVAAINQEFARVLFGSSTKAIGAFFKMRDGTRIQVVGLVQDGKYSSLTEDPTPAMFLPILQSPSSQTALEVRSSRSPQQLAAAIRSQLRSLDSGMSPLLQTWDEAMDFVLFPARVATMALGVLGLMGAMLSITGIFGMAAYSVSKRKRELGIRIALGAQRKEVLRAALGRALRLLAFGSAAGLILGILAARVLASIVYEASPRDPLVLTAVVVAMALVGLLATWIPAQRALSIDPAMLLREE